MPPTRFLGFVAATLAPFQLLIHAAADSRVQSLAEREKPAMLKTLEEVVGVESGSRDLEGLARLADLLAAQLTELGAKVEVVPAGGDVYRMADTPQTLGASVRATFTGTGTRSRFSRLIGWGSLRYGLQALLTGCSPLPSRGLQLTGILSERRNCSDEV